MHVLHVDTRAQEEQLANTGEGKKNLMQIKNLTKNKHAINYK